MRVLHRKRTPSDRWTPIATFLRVFAIACLAATGALAAPQESVLDYYLRLPNRYLVEGGDRNARLKAIKVKDVANGYLEIGGSWDGSIEIALFRKPDGSPLVAVVCSECGPLCSQTIRFLEPAGGEWVDRTAEVFPITREEILAAFKHSGISMTEDFGDDLPYLVVLPRRGRVIRIIVQPDFTAREETILSFTFENGQFVRVPTRP